MKERFFDIGVVSDYGDIKKTNEDTILVKTNYIKGEEIGIFVVADGISGLAKGKNASNLTIEVLAVWWDHYFLKMMLGGYNLQVILESLDDTVNLVNNQIFLSEQKSGTTLSILIIIGDIYIIRHVGDSRIYCVNKKIKLLTEDHIYPEELRKRGIISKDDAEFQTKKNLLTRCIGTKRQVETFKSFARTTPNDVYLLCSDGFHGYINETDILRILFDNRIFTMQDKVREFRKLITSGEAKDNVSIILIKQVEKR